MPAVGDLKIKPPSGSAFGCESPPMMPKLHQACLVVGPRGARVVRALDGAPRPGDFVTVRGAAGPTRILQAGAHPCDQQYAH